MPQCSPAYAVGRVRALEGTLIGKSAVERLAACESIEEMCRALSESGWGDAKSRKDIDALCDEHMKRACKLVKDTTSDERITDCFLIGYDALNLKTIFKSRALDTQAPLSELGIFDPEKLRRDVEERSYSDLPKPFAEAMRLIDRQSAMSLDPLFVDSEIDKAMYRFIAERIAPVKDETIRLYFTCKAEFVNLLIALRSGAMKRGAAFARKLFVEGGTLSFDMLEKVAEEPERAYDLIRLRPYADKLAKSVKAIDTGAIERAADDYLLDLMRPERYAPTSIIPLLGYLLARSREAMAIRLIAAAKMAGTPGEKVISRLRAMY
ncbi:MAG: V-type ATPase subunit [Clostridia bacterium]|nr:V-type ATPase subunit [Clostridia bacterium]